VLQNTQHLSNISHLQNIRPVAICARVSEAGHRGLSATTHQQDDVTMRQFAPNILASLAAITVSTTLLIGIL